MISRNFRRSGAAFDVGFGRADPPTGRFFSSFLYNDHGDYPGDIDFFLVDLAKGKIYMINQNT